MDKEKLVNAITNDRTHLGAFGGDYDIYTIQPEDRISDNEQAIIADWNDPKIKQSFYSALESIYDPYYWDEFSICSECHNLINTRPNGWGWEINALQAGCELLCLECLDDIDILWDVIESQYLNNWDKALPSRFKDQLIELGFSKINRDAYQNGLHMHMTDSPKQIIENLPNDFKSFDWIFIIDMVSQFYIEFSLYTNRESE